MRIEELSESRYLKGTDAVERYLLNIVQEYFKNTNVATTTSREFIIKQAVARMREEITFDSIGVLSITLPSGETRTGAVTITLEDLNGEPLISPKLSAFNVSFGNQPNTACEGNDPRLSDARKPTEHQHEISDIIGLEGILSTLLGKIERADGFTHVHQNSSVLNMLVYTGDKTEIDLSELETLEGKVVKLIDEIHQQIIDYRTEVDTKVQDIQTAITNVLTQIDTIKQYILDTNTNYYDLSKKYTDEQLKAAQDAIDTEWDKLVTKDNLTNALVAANNVFTLAGSMSFNLKTQLNFTESTSVLIPIDAAIITEITTRNQTLQECQVEVFIEYTDLAINKKVRAVLPLILFNDNIIDGSIQISTISATNQILLSFDSISLVVPEEIKNATITYNVYAKQVVTL